MGLFTKWFARLPITALTPPFEYPINLKIKVDRFKKISEELNYAMRDLTMLVKDCHSKLFYLHEFTIAWSQSELTQLKKLIRKLKGICKTDRRIEKREKIYVLDALEKIRNLIASKRTQQKLGIETDILSELTELKKDFDELEPILSAQIIFFEKYDDIGLVRHNIREFVALIREESKILFGVSVGDKKTVRLLLEGLSGKVNDKIVSVQEALYENVFETSRRVNLSQAIRDISRITAHSGFSTLVDFTSDELNNTNIQKALSLERSFNAAVKKFPEQSFDYWINKAEAARHGLYARLLVYAKKYSSRLIPKPSILQSASRQRLKASFSRLVWVNVLPHIPGHSVLIGRNVADNLRYLKAICEYFAEWSQLLKTTMNN